MLNNQSRDCHEVTRRIPVLIKRLYALAGLWIVQSDCNFVLARRQISGDGKGVQVSDGLAGVPDWGGGTSQRWEANRLDLGAVRWNPTDGRRRYSLGSVCPRGDQKRVRSSD